MSAPRRLEAFIPEHGFKHPDEMLEAFLAWVAEQGITLYPHQEEAILEIFTGNHVVLDAPTGSGKSLVAVAAHFKTFCELGRSWYTAPIKALVSEKFFALCEIFGAEHVGLMTGDGAVNRDAPIICCTAEILANLALREGEDARVDSVVMDEFHYYGDRDRGMAWQIPLLTLPHTSFVLMSATLGDTEAIRVDLEARTKRTVSEVRGVHRPVPLEFSYSTHPIHEALNDLARENKAPVYVVHFTQSAATEQAQALMSVDYCTKEEKKVIAEALHGFRFHSPFGPTVRRYVLHGVGLHHAGLLPRYRLLVERLAQQGLLKVICGTDTLGVGINVPIRTVLFTQLCKFDGESVNILKVRDFKQIAGRAGRAGFDRVGYVVAQAPAHVIENMRVDAKVTDPKKRRKIVRAQPPTRGYKPWDESTFRALVERPPEPLVGRFVVDHGRMLSLMQHAEDTSGDARDGYTALLDLIERSHTPPAEREKLRAQAEVVLESLTHAGVVQVADDHLVLDPSLPRDFSLHHSLSLFLLDALATLTPGTETHTLDVVSWVEAILENPRVVLERQADRARTAVMNELKMNGVPFEERIAALEDITWPKPNAEAIYMYFNGYVEKHPWVEGEGIRPKGILREMIELQWSFADYVKELGLQRAEGVLLRYLTEAYKALVQNVPPEHQTESLADAIAYVRAMLGMVDASLLTEWEKLLQGTDVVAETPRAVDISADRKSFYARLRAELHAIVRALSLGDWEEASACVRRGEEDPWGPDEIAEGLEPFVSEHGGVAFDHRARLATNTTIKQVGAHRWELRQLLFPLQVDDANFLGSEWVEQEERAIWALEGVVDLAADTNPDGPLVQLVRFGE